MALWTGAKDIRLTWTQSRTTTRIAGVGLLPDPDLPGEKDSERELVKRDY